MRVELVYDMKCPKISETRQQLIKAFTETGISSNWIEWDRGSSDTPDDVKLFGSPAILVNGIDIDGLEPSENIENFGSRIYYNEKTILRIYKQ